MERVSMDVLGPLPKSDAENKFILLICDYFTKWVEAFPIPNQEARTIADRFVKEFVCRYGVPRRIFTDQGANFQSDLFKEVCNMLDIDKDRTTPYHPQSDGFVERMNRTIEAMLSMFVSPGQRDWDEYLPYVMMAYRSAVQDTTGYSPNLMMLGREVELPVDILIGRPSEEGGPSRKVDYVGEMEEKMESAHKVAREKIQRRSDHQKRNYDLRVHGRKYERGQFVWLHNPARKVGVCPKLVRPWEGPFLVVKRMSDVTYRIQRNNKSKMKVVHFDRLKPYKGKTGKSWLALDEGTLVELNYGAMEEEMNEDLDKTIIYEHVNLPSGETNHEGGINLDVNNGNDDEMLSENITLSDNDCGNNHDTGNDTILCQYEDMPLNVDVDNILQNDRSPSEMLLDTEAYALPPAVERRRGGRMIRKPRRYDE
jgi:hypothetical protein